MKMNPLLFEVDLKQLDGEGEFPCPKCGVLISPDDWSETVYEIIDTKVKDDELEELQILCHKCGSKIRVFGWI